MSAFRPVRMRQAYVRIAFVVCPLLAIGSACADLPAPTGDFTCAADGVCAHPYGKKSLRLAYRAQDDEIFIEAVYRPYRGPMPEGTQPWCIRLVDRQTGTFFTKENSSCTEEWYPSGHKHVALDVAGVARRKAFMRPLADGLSSLVVSEERKEALAQCKRYLEMMIETQQSSPIGSLRQGVAPSVASRTLAEALAGHVEPSDEVDNGVMWGATVLEDDGSYGTTTVPDNTPGGDVPEAAYADASPGRGKAGSGDATFGRARQEAPETSPTEFISVPGFEFRQELALYSQPTKAFLSFGWKTRKHHSAAKIRVLFRKLGSDDAWQELDATVTANHGTAAGEGAMEQYAVCDNLPVTKEYFIWKGECEGHWLTHHFCNDDTAYQVYNAYGLWNGGNHCRDRHRDQRPSCEKPW